MNTFVATLIVTPRPYPLHGLSRGTQARLYPNTSLLWRNHDHFELILKEIELWTKRAFRDWALINDPQLKNIQMWC